MPVLAIILGLLLLLFGGGCTLIFLVGGVIDPQGMLADVPLLLSMWVPLGLLPLAGGWLLFRHGLKRDRARRRAAPKPPQEGQPP